jgi:hypothetical protein
VAEEKKKAEAAAAEIKEVLIVEEEEVEEEEESEIEVASPKKPEAPAEVKKISSEELMAKVKEAVRKQAGVKDTKYIGSNVLLKSIFDHPEYELKERLPFVRNQAKQT